MSCGGREPGRSSVYPAVSAEAFERLKTWTAPRLSARRRIRARIRRVWYEHVGGTHLGLCWWRRCSHPFCGHNGRCSRACHHDGSYIVSWSEHAWGELTQWRSAQEDWVAGGSAIAPEHNWADAQTVEAESPPVDTEHCWRCEVAAVSREDDVGLCDRCTEVLRDLTRPTVPDRGLQIPDASNGWLRIPFPPDVVMRSGEEFTFEVERDSAADAFRITVLTMNGILSQFTVPISSVLDFRARPI